MSMYRLLTFRDFTFMKHYSFHKIGVLTKLNAKICLKLLELAHNNTLPLLSKFPGNRKNRNGATL